MMRWFITLCACMLVGGFITYQIQKGSGYVLLVWGGTSIETSLWFALLVVIVLAILLLFVTYTVRCGLSGVRRIRKKIGSYSLEKAQQQTVQGLIDFIECNWLPAQKKLTRSAKKVPAPIINYLAASRCAYELKDEQEALRLLHEAEKISTNCELAMALTQARMQLANAHYEQALATLSRAEKVNENHQVVLSLQQQVYVALKDWKSLKQLLPKLHQNNIGSIKERYYLEQQLYRSWLSEKLQYAKNLEEGDYYKTLQQCWKELPKHFQQDEKILTDYLNELCALQQHDEAEALLVQSIARGWHDQWVHMYGMLIPKNKEQSLKTAEDWLKSHADNPFLLLTLGRLCLHNKQWGRAKDFFKSSLSLKPLAETYAELARLQSYLGEEKNSRDAWQQGLLSSIAPLTDIKELKP